MEYTKQRILTAVRIVLFFLCCYLVMDGQRDIGYPGLAEMGLGLVGILGIMWDYNRRNK